MVRLPLILMLTVLVAPFAVSLVLLDGKQNIADKARGDWLVDAHYVSELENNNWQILWREQDCLPECDAWFNVLQRAKMALGKNQNKVTISSAQLADLQAMNNGLFIANTKGLVLLSYDADENGAYQLLKDLKVLLKHNKQ